MKNTSGRSGRDIVNVETLSMHGARVASRIPQLDGIHDGFEDVNYHSSHLWQILLCVSICFIIYISYSFFSFLKLLHMPGVANEDYNTPVHQGKFCR